MNVTQGFTFKNLTADSPTFALRGGKYAVVSVATAYGTTKFQIMGPDGSTYVDIATLSANGISVYDLPPGTYKIASSGATGLNVSVVAVPY